MNDSPAGVDVVLSVLTTQRKQRLEWYEKEIEKRSRSLASIFREMRDDRLRPYLYTHESFEAYCKDRWNMTQRRTQQILAAENLKQILMLEAPELAEPIKQLKEYHVRELSKVEPDKRKEVLETAINLPGAMKASKINRAKSLVLDGKEPPTIEVCPKCGRPL